MSIHSSLRACSPVENPHSPPNISTFFFFNDTATTEIYTLSLHDALPIFRRPIHPRSGLAIGPDRLLARPVLGHPFVGRAAEDEAVEFIQLLDRELVELVVDLVPVDIPGLVALKVAVEAHHDEGGDQAAASQRTQRSSTAAAVCLRSNHAEVPRVTTTMPAPISHARWYPPANAVLTSMPLRTNSSEREPASVARTARPSAPPTWPVVFRRPEARPASVGCTSAIAIIVSAGNASPPPSPSSTIGASRWVT